jgi:branched-chain amino acid transport system ATP-binding protein
MTLTGDVLLEARQIRKTFGGLVALSDVDFTLNRNEMRAIIGPNGAGKSTFFNLIIGLLKPTAGHIVFKGRDITGLDKHRISRLGIATTRQITSIFLSMSVFDNVWLSVQSRLKSIHPLKSRMKMKEVAEKVEEILDLVDLGQRAGEIAGNLAYGEQRILEIALALGTFPELLLLDEPTSGLSQSETDRAIETIRELGKKMTIIIVEHDMAVIMELAENISVFHEGLLLAEGTAQEIREDETVNRVYFGEDHAAN